LPHKPFQTAGDILMNPSSGVFGPKTLDKREQFAPAQLALSQFLHWISNRDRFWSLIRNRLHLFEVFFLLPFRFSRFYTSASVYFLFRFQLFWLFFGTVMFCTNAERTHS
jgi:hypothetical protein